MRTKKRVFVVIKRVGELIELDRVYVSTTLRGVCREGGLKYGMVAKRWERRDKGVDRIWDSEGGLWWTVRLVELDMVCGRGGGANFRKKSSEDSGGGGFRGYRRKDGLLGDKIEKKKLYMGDEPVNKWKPGDDPE